MSHHAMHCRTCRPVVRICKFKVYPCDKPARREKTRIPIEKTLQSIEKGQVSIYFVMGGRLSIENGKGSNPTTPCTTLPCMTPWGQNRKKQSRSSRKNHNWGQKQQIIYHSMHIPIYALDLKLIAASSIHTKACTIHACMVWHSQIQKYVTGQGTQVTQNMQK